MGSLLARVVSTCSRNQLGEQQLLGLIADCVAGIEVGPEGQLGGHAARHTSQASPPRCIATAIDLWPR